MSNTMRVRERRRQESTKDKVSGQEPYTGKPARAVHRADLKDSSHQVFHPHVVGTLRQHTETMQNHDLWNCLRGRTRALPHTPANSKRSAARGQSYKDVAEERRSCWYASTLIGARLHMCGRWSLTGGGAAPPYPKLTWHTGFLPSPQHNSMHTV